MNKTLDLFIIIFSLVTFIFVGFSVFKVITTFAPDFTVLYRSASDLLQQRNPYTDTSLPDVFIYPVVTGLFYLPFSLLPYPIAQCIFVLLSAIVVPIIVYISLRAIGYQFSWRHIFIFTSLGYLSFPVKFTIGMGQSNLFALLLLVSGFYFYQKNHFYKSGIFVGLSYLLKPILSLTLLFFLLSKAWKTLRSISLIITILVLLASVAFGFFVSFMYLQTIVPALLMGGSNPIYYNQSFMGFMARLTTDATVVKYFSFGFSGLLLIFTFYRVMKEKYEKIILFAIFITLIPLIHSLSWQHHFALLLFPFMAATMKILQMRNNTLRIFLVIAYLLVSWNIKTPLIFSSFPASLFLSHVFYGCLLLLGILFTLIKNKK